MKSNSEFSRVYAPRIMKPSNDFMRLSLSGLFVIPPSAPGVLFLNGGLADRTVYLPAISSYAGQEYCIANDGTSNTLNIVDSNGIAVTTIAFGTMKLFMSSPSGWSFSGGSSGGSSESSNWTTQTVTAATGTGVATDSEILVNRAGTVTITLPDAALWFAQHATPASYLQVLDISGAASSNNITIQRAGADTINGLTSVNITSDYSGFKFRRVATNLWGIVG